MDLIQAIEVFATVTGIIYVVLEILQLNSMWVVGILTGAACAWSFGVQHLWASMGLNLYYVAISVWGLWQWRKDGERSEGGIHLTRPTPSFLALSAVLLVVGSAALVWVLSLLGDSMSVLDAVVAVMSAIGTWWLGRSIPQQWLVWIVADILSTILCWKSGMPWMSGLYIVYAFSAVYGWYHWNKNGKYI